MYGFGRGMMGFDGERVIEIGRHVSGLEIVCMVLGFILWAVVVTTLVLVIINLARRLRTPAPAPADRLQAATLPPGASAEVALAETDALRVLQERYARGEIDQKEYLKRKNDLAGPS